MRTAVLAVMTVAVLVGCSPADDDGRRTSPSTAPAQSATDSVSGSSDSAGQSSVPSTASVSATSAPGPSVSSAAATTLGDLPDPTATPDPTTFGELGETDAVITGDRGTLQIGEVELPAALDADFPLPDDLTVVLASEVDDSLGFTGSTALTFDAAVELYRDGLPAAGYAVEEGQFIDGVVAVFAFDGPDGRGDVALSAGPDRGTDVIVTFES